ncbi:MAG: hypothetical protein Q9M29_05205 [Mariprofundaceae bacterium]|nr:hypothetical protein [Mariprofundaceae bacterium]
MASCDQERSDSLSRLSDTELTAIGQRIYHNECNGEEACLTSWNAGEEFASLGIGHFIWYPAGTPRRFDESFPGLLRFMHTEGVAMPSWLTTDARCPWPDRQAFLAAKNSPKMVELRLFLAETMQKQAEFMAKRLENALPGILAAVPASRHEHIRSQFNRVAQAPMGMYALMDYVNFKGEGVKESERYHGQGWGLLQVLDAMQGEDKGPEAVRDFARTAQRILMRRVRNSPPGRNEERWLPGWTQRLQTYVAAGSHPEEAAG